MSDRHDQDVLKFLKKNSNQGKYDEVKQQALNDILLELNYQKPGNKKIDEYVE